MSAITDKKQYPSEQYLNELITNIEFAARAPVEVVRAMAAELQKRREADSAEPVNQTYNLPELIEGMEVSIDVSTCDADLGNRYFGTVTEALELDTAKNGYILLVQDAEPNFDVNGNSPVTPDGWISCSERMPNDAQWCVVNTEYGYYVQCWSEGQGWLGDDISIPECDVINWMPLPEPPQEVKRG
ncbi:TPA: DUF551 domain-containing protein [Escherichia coli]|nr:DUF551 domain-containing protein [Escherichia coli]EKY6075368.1 DUF551 domain-containing protein [Escherichia coli]EKY6103985.1 DUF551 domain-containing protein [Escherichia coli]